MKVILFLCIVGFAIAADRVRFGEEYDIPPDDPHARHVLQTFLATMSHDPREIVLIVKITGQIVQGERYKFDYVSHSVRSDMNYQCHTVLVGGLGGTEIPWLVEHDCFALP